MAQGEPFYKWSPKNEAYVGHAEVTHVGLYKYTVLHKVNFSLDTGFSFQIL